MFVARWNIFIMAVYGDAEYIDPEKNNIILWNDERSRSGLFFFNYAGVFSLSMIADAWDLVV